MALMRDEAKDVSRLFECLVRELEARDPAQLQTPFQISELYQSIVPYRSHRSQLGLDSNQDYEMAVLHLLAGEGGYATVEPEEVQAALAHEAEEVSPDPGAFREYAGARVRLHPTAVARVLDAAQTYAPPDPVTPTDEPEPESEVTEAAEPTVAAEPVFALDVEHLAPEPPPPPPRLTPTAAVASPACKHCGRILPLHRDLTYCPFCGNPAHALVCRQCGDELEATWRYCGTCGTQARSRPSVSE